MEMIEFKATRCLDGYEIKPLSKRARKAPAWLSGPRVVRFPQWTVPGAPEAAIVAASERFEYYDPTNFSALFRIFADAPATAAGMCDFAKKFGLPADSDGGGNVVAMALGPLFAHHVALRKAADRFEAGDAAGVADLFNVYWGRMRMKLLAGPGGKLDPVLVPLNLVQFMWLQFALHAASGAKLLRCERCGGPFRVGSGTRRRDTAKYCTNACKVAAFQRRRKTEAVAYA
jgi:hypothetical protein